MGQSDMDFVVTTYQTLLRYVSEWDPKAKGKAKGGYLLGAIKVPKVSTDLVMRLSICPTEKLVEEIMIASSVSEEAAMAHPLLLHNVRKGKGKLRNRDLEPVPCYKSWNQRYIIDTAGNVRICNDHHDVDQQLFLGVDPATNTTRTTVPLNPWSPDALVTTLRPHPDHPELGDHCIVLGPNEHEMNLKELQPKQKSRARDHEANITDVLVDRVGNADSAKYIEGFYEKKLAINMKMFRIRVQFFTDETCQTLLRLSNSLTADMTSDVIKDTGNKKTGALDISHAINLKSCCEGGRQVSIHSEYALARNDVKPQFGVYDPNDMYMEDPPNHIDKYDLIQPDESQTHVGNLGVIFRTPKQNYTTVSQILRDGYQIKLLLHRNFDGYESPQKFTFSYVRHESGCVFCDKYKDIDGIDHCSGETVTGMVRAKPGMVKRKVKKRNCSSRDTPPPTPDSGFASTSSRSSTPPRKNNNEEMISLDDLLKEVDLDDLRDLFKNMTVDDWIESLQRERDEKIKATIGKRSLTPDMNNYGDAKRGRMGPTSTAHEMLISGSSVHNVSVSVPKDILEEMDYGDLSDLLHTPRMEENDSFDLYQEDGAATFAHCKDIKVPTSTASAKDVKVEPDKETTIISASQKRQKTGNSTDDEEDNAMVKLQLFMFLFLLLIFIMMVAEVSQTAKMVVSGMMGTASILFYLFHEK